MFARTTAPAPVAGAPVTAPAPHRATSRLAPLAAGLALLAAVAGPGLPSADAALDLPPQQEPKLESPLAGDGVAIRLPDLQVRSIAIRDAQTLTPGAVLDVIGMVENTGEGAAGHSRVGFTLAWAPSKGLSAVGDLRGSVDVPVGDEFVPALDAGAVYVTFTEGGAWHVTVPAGTRSGTYRLRACADATRIVPETSNTNNYRLSDERVQIRG